MTARVPKSNVWLLCAHIVMLQIGIMQSAKTEVKAFIEAEFAAASCFAVIRQLAKRLDPRSMRCITNRVNVLFKCRCLATYRELCTNTRTNA